MADSIGKNLGDNLGKANNEMAKMLKTMEALAKAEKLQNSFSEQILSNQEELNGALQKELKLEKELNKLADNNFKKKKDQKELDEEMVVLAKEELAIEEKKLKTQKEMVKSGNDLGNAYDAASDGVGRIKDMLKAGPKDIRSTAKSAGAWAERMTQVGTSLKGVKGAFGAAGQAAVAMGATVGKISGLLRGWPGLVLMGLKAMVDVAVKYDNWIKGLNRDFAEVRGPDLFTGDVQKQMANFNKEVFDIGANIRDGWDRKDVMGFAQAFVQAGQALSKITNNLSDFRDATHIAAKANAAFGMEGARSAQLMSNMMSELRMNLKQVDDAFTQVSFEAQKSGMSTERFWGAIENATASLSLYGKFIKGVSKSLTDITKTQVVGTKESIELNQKIVDDLNKGFAENMKSMAMMRAGGFKFGDAFAKEGKILEASLKQLEQEKLDVEVKYKSATGDEQKKLQEKLDDLNTQITNNTNNLKSNNNLVAAANKFDATGDPKAMAQIAPALARLSNYALPMATAKLKGITSNLGVDLSNLQFGDKGYLEAVAAISSNFEYSEKEAKEMLAMLNNVRQTTATTVGDVSTRLKDLQKAGFKDKETVDVLKGIRSDGTYTTSEAETASATLANLLGITRSNAEELVSSSATSEAVKNKLIEYMTKAANPMASLEDMNTVFDKLLSQNEYGIKKQAYDNEHRKKTESEIQGSYDNTFDQMRDQTTTFEKMKDIVKDGLSYQAGSIMLFRNIDTWVTKIGRNMLSKKPDKDMKASRALLDEKNINWKKPEEAILKLERENRAAQKTLTSSGSSEEAKAAAGAKISENQGYIEHVRAAATDINQYKIDQGLNPTDRQKFSGSEESSMFRDSNYVARVTAKGGSREGWQADYAKSEWVPAQQQLSAPLIPASSAGAANAGSVNVPVTINAEAGMGKALERDLKPWVSNWVYQYQLGGN